MSKIWDPCTSFRSPLLYCTSERLENLERSEFTSSISGEYQFLVLEAVVVVVEAALLCPIQSPALENLLSHLSPRQSRTDQTWSSPSFVSALVLWSESRARENSLTNSGQHKVRMKFYLTGRMAPGSFPWPWNQGSGSNLWRWCWWRFNCRQTRTRDPMKVLTRFLRKDNCARQVQFWNGKMQQSTDKRSLNRVRGNS